MREPFDPAFYVVRRNFEPVWPHPPLLCETLIENDTPAGHRTRTRGDYHCSDCHTLTRSLRTLQSGPTSSSHTHSPVLATYVIVSPCLQLLSELIKREGTGPE